MNWFERYGIVGMYFLIALFVWYTCLFAAFEVKETVLLIEGIPIKYIGALFGFMFLPIGYIIMVFSQWLYYKGLYGRQTHLKVLDKLSNESRKNEIIGEHSNSSEAEVEMALTYFDRIRMKFEDTKKVESLAVWIRKRFDVIAINNGVLLATLLSFASAVIIKLVVSYPSFNMIVHISSKLIACFLLFSLVVFIVLISQCPLEDQIIKIEKKLFDEAEVQNKKNNQS